MKDLIAELETVRRRVGSAELPAGEARVVTLSRTYPAAVEDVWDAVTNPERIPRWFLPVSGDLRVGGTYQTEGNAGGEIRVCDAPHRLQITWVMGPAGSEDSSLVDVRLEASDDGTRLTLEHTAVTPPEFWDQFGPGAVGVGWDGALLGLALHLDGADGPMSPEELGTNPEIRAFNTASSEAWGAALAAADGLDPEVVAARVAATTAFYVPPPEDGTPG
ncbi:SRPBCC family protein [Cellulosimicrobium marinum]|uniref:SRPBCC family protein n=1 Tax=Cellulosimicrobium marinum TaxID=1638992 RepID=UPI001E328A70|nr:SRPBCC family protein [Cellulosimicrobium marinum]MCB7137105.1 SRPBCC family protein [Cellulosimicrobium marinum]